VKTYSLVLKQNIPITLDEAWDFFSSPLNLAKITPKEMKFVVTSNYNGDTKMYPGMIITYKVSPLFGIKLNWMTEITHVQPNKYFVDEQRFGPYALWHHQHHFKEIPGGVEMTDILNYAVPYGVIGRITNSLLVGKEVKRIFNYRYKAVEYLFGKYVNNQAT
jgi:ligand-binding SRPBCC domain-containing protein